MNHTEKATALTHFRELERILGSIEEKHGTIQAMDDHRYVKRLHEQAKQHIDQAKTIIDDAQTTEQLAEAVLAVFEQCKCDIAASTDLDVSRILSRALADIARLAQPYAPKKVEAE